MIEITLMLLVMITAAVGGGAYGYLQRSNKKKPVKTMDMK